MYHPKSSPPTMTIPLLSSPANNAANQDTALTLSWAAVTGATYYRVQVSTDSLFHTFAVNDTTHTTSKHIGPLAQVKTYFWRVNAHSYYLDGCYQDTARTFATKLYPPSPPNLLAPANNIQIPPTTTFRWNRDRKSTRLNSSHIQKSRMPSSA